MPKPPRRVQEPDGDFSSSPRPSPREPKRIVEPLARITWTGEEVVVSPKRAAFQVSAPVPPHQRNVNWLNGWERDRLSVVTLSGGFAPGGR
ncbi:hypothetical protein E5D57_006345 [Metarhizium anisopliae]|nr:hypothetical protein E5D57_006345 [Metarhizium anisopliae]